MNSPSPFPPRVILHLTDPGSWSEARRAGTYRGDTLDTEGFIHCSTRDQILGTANRFFTGRTDLLLLVIDEEKVRPPIRYENLEGGESLFPHVYGELDLDAIVAVLQFPWGEGGFVLPGELR